MAKANIEPIEVTMLRAMVKRHTTGWVVTALASIQEDEPEPNLNCAYALRNIVDERNGVPYVFNERLRGMSTHDEPLVPYKRHFDRIL